jgi:hypothetical protein
MPPKYGFLADGYTLEHCIPESPFHPECNITFRPATPVERVTVIRELAKLDRADKVAEAEKRAFEFIAKKLVSWDLVAPPITEGAIPQTVEISLDNLLKIESHLGGAIMEVVIGNAPAVAKQLETDEKN